MTPAGDQHHPVAPIFSNSAWLWISSQRRVWRWASRPDGRVPREICRGGTILVGGDGGVGSLDHGWPLAWLYCSSLSNCQPVMLVPRDLFCRSHGPGVGPLRGHGRHARGAARAAPRGHGRGPAGSPVRKAQRSVREGLWFATPFDRLNAMAMTVPVAKTAKACRPSTRTRPPSAKRSTGRFGDRQSHVEQGQRMQEARRRQGVLVEPDEKVGRAVIGQNAQRGAARSADQGNLHPENDAYHEPRRGPEECRVKRHQGLSLRHANAAEQADDEQQLPGERG